MRLKYTDEDNNELISENSSEKGKDLALSNKMLQCLSIYGTSQVCCPADSQLDHTAMDI